MVVRSIRHYPQWHMPDIIWQAVLLSVIAHIASLLYLWQDFDANDSVVEVPGNMNIVLQTTIETIAPKKANKEIEKKVVKHVEPLLKPEPLIKQVEEAKADEPERSEPVKEEPVAPTSEIAEIKQQSYVPPRSDASYLSNPKPFYPRAAKRRGMQGTVLLEVEVDSNGKPLRISIANSSGYRLLDRAALDTVKEWQFVPAQRDGIAVVALVDVPVKFVLNDE